MPQIFLTEGKGEYVRRVLASGEVEDVCRCKWNADFAKACIAQVHGAYIEEVIRNGGKYDAGSMPKKRREHGINHRCQYCYSYTNWGQVTPRTVGDKTEKEFQDKKPAIVRIGKNVECGHDFYVPTLLQFLELCKKYDAQIIFPTKMLRFQEEVAESLRQVGGVVHYSIGADCLERGAVSQGYNNSWRLQQARKYREAGVNLDLTVVCDVTQSLAGNVKAGFFVQRALDIAQTERLVARIIPIRIKSNKLAIKVTGHSRGELLSQHPNLPTWDNLSQGMWERRPNNELRPLVLHPDFRGLYESGIGICGEIGDYEYCDDCHICPSCPKRIVFPVSQKPKVVYTRKLDAKQRKSWKDRAREEELKKQEALLAEQERKQLKLF
jgi:hypothetical protein